MSEPHSPAPLARDAAPAAAPAVVHVTLTQLAVLARVRDDWLHERLRDGLVCAAVGHDASSEARFDVVTIRRVQRMARIERDFDAVPELAALVADLQGEIDHLRDALRLVGR